MVSKTNFRTGTTDYIGTTTEKTALATSGLVPFSTFYDTTASTGYVWDGTAWQAVTLTYTVAI